MVAPDRAAAPKRVLPHNLDAEASVLGGILLRNEILTGLDALEVDDFYDPRHKAVFGAMRNLEHAGKPIDVVTLEVELDKAGKLDSVGGVAFIGELVLRVPTPENVEHYAQIVQEHHLSRRLMLAMSEVVEMGYRGGEGNGGDELIGEALSRILHIGQARKDPVVSMGDAVRTEYRQMLDDLDARDRGERVLVGMPTGIAAIDDKVGGIPFSVLSLVLARPANGKTTLGDHLCWAAEEYGNDIPIMFSFEDSVQSMAQRRIAGASGIPTTNIRARKIDGGALRDVTRGYAIASQARGLLVKCAGWTVEQIVRCARSIRARSQRYARETGRTVGRTLVVDYLQKVRNPEWARGNRNIGLGWICEVLSNYAQDEESAVVLMSQVNREVEKGDDGVPRLHHARDSGEIEQHCKFALGLKRPWNYEPNADPTALHAYVLKNHNGPANGLIEIYWEIETHTLANSALDIQQRRLARRPMP